jgi:hypothetical protein
MEKAHLLIDKFALKDCQFKDLLSIKPEEYQIRPPKQEAFRQHFAYLERDRKLHPENYYVGYTKALKLIQELSAKPKTRPSLVPRCSLAVDPSEESEEVAKEEEEDKEEVAASQHRPNQSRPPQTHYQTKVMPSPNSAISSGSSGFGSPWGEWPLCGPL